MSKEKIAAIAVAVGAVIVALLVWFKTKAKPPVEDTTKCEGFDLFTFTSGQWTLTEANSPACGWTPTEAKFELTNLIISPDKCFVGDSIQISCLATNTGPKLGTKTVVFTTNGISKTKSITVDSGKSKSCSFTFTPTAAKTYIIKIDGLEGYLNVATGAVELTISDLYVTPSRGVVGSPVNISVIVSNKRARWGTKTIVCTADGLTESRTVTLQPGKSEKITFQLIPTEAKVYNISVDGLGTTITVTAAGAGIVVKAVVIPAKISLGESVTPAAEIMNVGATDCTRTFNCYVNNVFLSSVTRGLSAGAYTKINFRSFKPTAVGTYTVRVNGKSATLEVVEMEERAMIIYGSVTSKPSGNVVSDAKIVYYLGEKEWRCRSRSDGTFELSLDSDLDYASIPWTLSIYCYAEGYRRASVPVHRGKIREVDFKLLPAPFWMGGTYELLPLNVVWDLAKWEPGNPLVANTVEMREVVIKNVYEAQLSSTSEPYWVAEVEYVASPTYIYGMGYQKQYCNYMLSFSAVRPENLDQVRSNNFKNLLIPLSPQPSSGLGLTSGWMHGATTFFLGTAKSVIASNLNYCDPPLPLGDWIILMSAATSANTYVRKNFKYVTRYIWQVAKVSIVAQP